MNKPPVQVSATVIDGAQHVALTLDMRTDQPIQIDGIPPARALTVIQTLDVEDALALAAEITSLALRLVREQSARVIGELERETSEAVGAAVLDAYSSRVYPAVIDAEARRGSYWLGDG